MAVACNTTSQQPAKDITKTDSTALLPRPSAKGILAMYEELPGFDTLNLGTVERDTLGQMTGKYKGRWLDSAYSRMLPVVLTNGIYPNEENDFTGFYACYKFPINERLTGLLTRTPGEYDISVLSLLYYDHDADSVGYAFDLLHDWGDAGDAVSYNTWLIRNQQSVDAWMAVNSIWEEAGDSVYNSNTIYFKADLAARTLDTAYKNKPEWAETFKYLIGEKTYEVPDSTYVNKHTISE
ncbi:hypothetical protein EG028_21465 [Chitinophaga barathri]|uniref:Uncharacterized protein n=2 Tax=Chitinophaga barathri TaxID=1647451 RepID=A0A3N4MUP7_9BACT|nr:hypothetical protein EG028_21465 [Chitinophaga barathri]